LKGGKMSDMPLNPGPEIRTTVIALTGWSDKNRTFAEYLSKCDGWENYTICHWVEARKIPVFGEVVKVIWSLHDPGGKPVAYIPAEHPEVVFVMGDDKILVLICRKYFEHETKGAIYLSNFGGG